MELLIPGLILVALMVYASTRIKKTAALAFESETIETKEFIIQKPDGFLNVLGGDPHFAFEAYSKDFGGAGAEEFRRGTAKLRIHDKMSVDNAVADILSAGNEVVSDIGEVIAERKYRVIEITRIEKETKFRILYKIAESRGRTYELETAALANTNDEVMRKIEAMVDSFEIR